MSLLYSSTNLTIVSNAFEVSLETLVVTGLSSLIAAASVSVRLPKFYVTPFTSTEFVALVTVVPLTVRIAF